MTTNKQIVAEVNEAFNQYNLEGFLKHCAEAIRWTIVGKEPVVGHDAIREFMGQMSATNAMSITAHNIIGDGEFVACDGRMEMAASENGKGYRGAFCDVYRFEGGKIAELNSYVVDLK